MRGLLQKIDPSLWSEISGIIFLVAFIALLFWVYRPSRKEIYQRYASLVIDQD